MDEISSVARKAAFMLRNQLLAMLCILTATFAGPSATANAAEENRRLTIAVGQAINFLATARAEDGSYSGHLGTGITSLVTTALLRHGRSPQDPMIAPSLVFLQNHVQSNGGIYQKDSRFRNYETCLAILCFNEANREGRYDDLLAHAEAFVKSIQWDGKEGHDRSSTSFGGAGYGMHNRPDLSNTTFLIDALHSLGRGSEDPAIQRALVFVSRCQNLETEHNDTKFATTNPDGGFYYTAAAGGSSQAGETAAGGLRSYGSMTYAGLKSMIYAGVGPDDPRVQAAFRWAKKNYSVTENPGMGNNGLFYYYHTLAKALDAIGQEKIVDETGVSHSWRQELIDEIAERQLENGSWINENQRWLEGDPSLVTGYVLLTLSYCRTR